MEIASKLSHASKLDEISNAILDHLLENESLKVVPLFSSGIIAWDSFFLINWNLNLILESLEKLFNIIAKEAQQQILKNNNCTLWIYFVRWKDLLSATNDITLPLMTQWYKVTEELDLQNAKTLRLVDENGHIQKIILITWQVQQWYTDTLKIKIQKLLAQWLTQF